MKRINNFLLMLMLLSLVAPAYAADGDLLKPGMGREWLSAAGTDVRNVLNWVLGALVVAVIVCFIIFSGKAGITIMGNSGGMGNPNERSQGQTSFLNVLFGLVIIVLLVKVGLMFFQWY